MTCLLNVHNNKGVLLIERQRKAFLKNMVKAELTAGKLLTSAKSNSADGITMIALHSLKVVYRRMHRNLQLVTYQFLATYILFLGWKRNHICIKARINLLCRWVSRTEGQPCASAGSTSKWRYDLGQLWGYCSCCSGILSSSCLHRRVSILYVPLPVSLLNVRRFSHCVFQ